MKLTILLVVISLLPLIACDVCEPGHFWSPNLGCNKCFCSGVTDKCHAGSFFTHIISTDRSEIRGLVDWPNRPTELTRYDSGASALLYALDEEYANKVFVWELPFKFYEHRVRNYGGSVSVVQGMKQRNSEIWEYPPVVIRIVSSEVNISYAATPLPLGSTTKGYEAIITEKGAYIGEDPSQLATKADVMRALVSANKILALIDHPNKWLVYVSEFVLEVAAAHSTGFHKREGIEVCDCPEGYSGDSCESCAEEVREPCKDIEPCEDQCNDYGVCFGCPHCEFEYTAYRRNINNKTESVFGACESGDPEWFTS